MMYIKGIIGVFTFCVIVVVKLPATIISALTSVIERGLLSITKSSVELANIDSLTDIYNLSIMANSYLLHEYAVDLLNLRIEK